MKINDDHDGGADYNSVNEYRYTDEKPKIPKDFLIKDYDNLGTTDLFLMNQMLQSIEEEKEKERMKINDGHGGENLGTDFLLNPNQMLL